MNDDKIPTAISLEDNWLPLDLVASICEVEPEWLLRHIEEGFFSEVSSVGGTWRFSSAMFVRVRRMREMENLFEAAPELAALVADMQEEIERLRSRLRQLAL